MFTFEQVVIYVFLLRIPIVFLLVAIFFPWIALGAARSLLRNLYDHDPRGAGFSVLATLALIWSAVLSAYPTLRHDERFGPDYIGWADIGPGWPVAAPFAVAVIPTIYAIRKRMGPRFTPAHWRACGIAVVVGFAVAWLSQQVVVPTIELVQSYLPADGLPVGYVDEGRVSGSQIFALGGFVTSVIAYAVLGLIRRPLVPTLAYVNILLCILCWALSGLSFYLDAYRIPVVLALFAVLFVSGYLVHQKSDHYFSVAPCKDNEPPDPCEVIETRSGDPVIVVAANGGGIQSAAWTARVLCGLDDKWRAYATDKDLFRRSIRLISGVSGGSVGAMHFLSTYDGVTNEDAVRNARTSSLADVAWGLVYPDFLTLLFPWTVKPLSDRGNAIEKAWKRTGAKGIDHSLSEHYQSVRDGTRPAVVYNATITETGERVLMGTTSIAAHEGDGRRNLNEILHGCDVRSVTAARLSATFPFVTPVARPYDKNPAGFHLADGGYYDNYGTVTAVEWLHEALSTCSEPPSRVLLLELHGAPPDTPPGGTSRGWAYQLFAPIACMLSVRTAGQLAHKTLEVGFLQKYWADRDVSINVEIFQFGKPDPPLSWHLGQDEQDDIDQQFELFGDRWMTVRNFLEKAQVAKA